MSGRTTGTTRMMARASSRSIPPERWCGTPMLGSSALVDRLRSRTAAAFAGGLVALGGGTAFAQTWHFIPSVALQETLTSNVNLSPSATAQSDLVSQLTPQLA